MMQYPTEFHVFKNSFDVNKIYYTISQKGVWQQTSAESRYLERKGWIF